MELEDFAQAILDHALALPETWEDHPWGESAIKVRKKAFLFSGFSTEDAFGISLKLPQSAAEVLEWELASPTGYGLGKHGWVSIRWSRSDALPLALAAVLPLIEESYAVVAPKTVVKKWLANR